MITIELPWPHPALAPNRANGKHWAGAGLAEIKSKAKSDAYFLTRIANNGGQIWPVQYCALAVTFHAPDKRRRDLDGMLSSMKHALDGVAQALGLDDHYFRPVTLDYQHGAKPGKVIVQVGA